MKRLFGCTALLLGLCLCLCAKGQTKCAVKVEQNYHGWTHCNTSDVPKMDETKITVGDTVVVLHKDKEAAIFEIGVPSSEESFDYKSLKVVYGLAISHYGKGSAKEKRDTINDSIAITGHRIYEYKEGQRTCFLKQHEGFSVTYDVVVDDPIRLELEEKGSWVVENGDKVKIHFNDFFENRLDRHFEYKIESDPNAEWREFRNEAFKANAAITPNGTIEIAYEDIFGSDTEDEEYKRASGKKISIRVVKTLIGDKGTQTSSNIVQACFYHKGPDFVIEDIRIPYCKKASEVDIYVRVTSEAGKFHDKDGNYQWVIKDGAINVTKYEPVGGNRYKLILDKPDMLKEGTNTLQLQLKNSGSPLSYDFAKREFTVPKPLSGVEVSQLPSDNSFHIPYAKDPYIKLNIEDPVSDRGPYKVYRYENGEWSDYITAISQPMGVSDEILKHLKDSLYNVYESSTLKKEFYDECATRWYYDNANTDKVRVFKSDAVTTPKNEHYLEDDVHCGGDDYIASSSKEYGNTMYFVVSEHLSHNNEKTKDTQTTIYAFECKNIAEDSPYIYLGGCKLPTDWSVNGYVSVVFYDGEESLNLSSSESINYVCQDGNFILAYGKGSKVMLFHDEETDFIPFDRYNQALNDALRSSDSYLMPNNDVVSVKNGVLTCFHFNGSEWDGGETFETYKWVASARDVVMESDYIAYNATDGQSYNEYYEPNLTTFLREFNYEHTIWVSKSDFKEKWEERKEALFNQYVLANYGYRLRNDKLSINKVDSLRLIDNDGCPYKFEYLINANNDIETTIEAGENPTNAEGNNGTATIHVKKIGGDKNVRYKGTIITKEGDIPVGGLHWDANTEFLTVDGGNDISLTVTLTPKVKISATPQTCKELGTIKIEGEDASKGLQWAYRKKGDDARTELAKGVTMATGLEHGMYVVEGCVTVEGENIWINVGEIEVEDRIFKIESVNVSDATEIGGKGTAEIKLKNAHGNLTWSGVQFGDGSDGVYEKELPRNEYKVGVTDENNCKADTAFFVDGPWVKEDVIVLNEDGLVSINVSGEFGELIENPEFVLYSGGVESVKGRSIEYSGKYEEEATYAVALKYGEHTYQKESWKGIKPLNIVDVTEDKSNPKRCAKQLGVLKTDINKSLSALGKETLFRIGSSGEWQALKESVAVEAGDFTVQYMTQTTSDRFVNQAIRTRKISIAPGIDYNPEVEVNDVSCYNSTDGGIELETTGLNGEKAWLSVDGRTDNGTSITNLPAGDVTYYVVMERCPDEMRKHIGSIMAPDKELKMHVTVTQPSCSKGGVLTVEAEGGWGEYTMNVKDLDEREDGEGDGVETFEVLTAKSYHVQVEDEKGCIKEADAEICEYVNPSVTRATTDNCSCNGRTDGRINGIEVKTNGTLNGKAVTAEKLVYSLTHKDGRKDKWETDWTDIIEGLAAGTYSLTVKDSEGCETDEKDEYTITVSEPEPVLVTATELDNGRITYKGGADGRMEIKVTGGNASNYNNVMYGGKETFVPTNVPYTVGGLNAGTIAISATDSKNCPSNKAKVTFVEPEKELKIEAETTPALCHAMTGAVKVKADGGWGDHRIRLVGERESRNSNGEQSEADFESLYAGDYTIEVTDKYGAKATQTIRVDAPEPISHELVMTPDHCGGNGGGTIELSGGTGDYKSVFANRTDTIRGERIEVSKLVGGRDYALTTWDANRCESHVTFTMPDEQLKAAVRYTYTSDGVKLTAEVTGGIAPYTYRWQDVSHNETLGTSSIQTVTQSGLYRLDVSDGSGCEAEPAMQPVLMVGSIAMRVKAVTRTTNPDNNDGTATIECKATQRASLRMYHLETDTWTTDVNMKDETTIELSGLTPGHYYVEGEMEDGNKQMAQFFIAPYEPMEVTKVDVRHVSAPERNDARVVVDFEGGIAPYTVNDTATFETGHIEIANLKAGDLALAIADSTGNVLRREVKVLEPEPIVVIPKEVVDATCNTYDDGSVTLTATGGWGDYQFAKGDGEYRNSAYFGELNAGERTFKVVDKYGVEDSVTVAVGEPDMLRASVAAIDSVSCKGMNDGAAHFTLTGGTAPYRTIYEKETLDGTDVAHLLAGTYVMKFTDSHGCKCPDTLSIYIPEPDLLEVASDEVVNTTCELDNGKIAIEVKGGSLPYRYEWKENGATYGGAKTVNMVRSEATGLKQNGLYHITIYDLHGCKAEYDRRIEHSENPRVLGVATTDVLCYGSSDGIAEVDSSHVRLGYPKANYRLTWPQGQTGVMAVNTLPAGTYLVKITDDNNCSTTREFTVGSPEPVKNHLSGVRDALCYGYSDGRIETHTTGGVGEYKYAWSTGETTSFAENLKAGAYTVVVADSHECKDTATYEVTEPEELKVNLGDDVLICPGNVHVFDAGEYATYSWSSVAKGEEIETERFLATGEEGDYAIKVTDEIGCIARDTVSLRIGENALQANFLMASDAAVNDTIMLIELSNMPVDSVRWQYDKLMTVDVEDAEEYMFPLMAESTGRYYITMWAYSGGCESFEQKFIDIYEAVEDTSNFKIGYDPLIKQAKVSPNPNNGEFDLIVVLREKADVDVMVHDVNNGRQVEHVVLKDSDKYNKRLNIRQWGSGIFVLSIVSGEERRAIKVLCVR